MPPRVIWGGYVGVASYILAEAAAPSRDEKKRSELGGHGTNCRLASNPETLEEDIREKEVEELREGRLGRVHDARLVEEAVGDRGEVETDDGQA